MRRQVAGLSVGKRGNAHCRVVERATERVDIGPKSSGAALTPLEECTRKSLRCDHHWQWFRAHSLPGCSIARGPVGHLGVTGGGNDDVGRLDVSMYEALRKPRLETSRYVEP